MLAQFIHIRGENRWYYNIITLWDTLLIFSRYPNVHFRQARLLFWQLLQNVRDRLPQSSRAVDHLGNTPPFVSRV
jgi:hypothetical protein